MGFWPLIKGPKKQQRMCRSFWARRKADLANAGWMVWLVWKQAKRSPADQMYSIYDGACAWGGRLISSSLANVWTVVYSPQLEGYFWTLHPSLCMLGKAPATCGPEQMYKEWKGRSMAVNAFMLKPNLNHFVNGKMYFCTFSPFADYLNEIYGNNWQSLHFKIYC